MARLMLVYWETQYRETGEPLYAWEALLAARTGGVKIPPIVLDYLERCAQNITKASRRTDAFKPSPAVAIAMEFVTNRPGPGNKLKVHQNKIREMSIASALHWAIWKAYAQRQPHEAVKEVAIEKSVGATYGISGSQARRYWKKYEDHFPSLDDFKI